VATPAPWDDLLIGRARHALVRIGPGPATVPRVLLPGSFNPVHASHLKLARLASARLGHPVDFELSVRNVEKPPLDPASIALRAAGLRQAIADDPSLGHLWLTSAPTFAEKARLFPGTVFVVGLDTFRRVADPSFHGGPSGHASALSCLADLSSRFLVFFRHLGPPDGWDDPARYPAPLARMVEFVSVCEYADEEKMSSRALRADATAAATERPGRSQIQ
jgi:hypothetical protein